MKTKSLNTPNAKLSHPIRDLHGEVRNITQDVKHRTRGTTFDVQESLKKCASLSTCDTLNIGFLTGMLVTPRIKK